MGKELILLLFPAYFTWVGYFPVFWLQVAHLFFYVLGIDFFLDELVVLALEHWVPLVTWLVSFVTTLFGLLVHQDGASEPWGTIVFFYALQAIWFNRVTYRLLPDAIRFVNPEWDRVPVGEPLWPGIFYAIGFVDYPERAEDQEVQNDSS